MNIQFFLLFQLSLLTSKFIISKTFNILIAEDYTNNGLWINATVAAVLDQMQISFPSLGKVNYLPVDLATLGEVNVLTNYLKKVAYNNSDTVDGVIGLRDSGCSILPRVGSQSNILIVTHACECNMIDKTYITSFLCAKEIGRALFGVLRYFGWSRALLIASNSTEQEYYQKVQTAMRNYQADYLLNISVMQMNNGLTQQALQIFISSIKDISRGNDYNIL